MIASSSSTNLKIQYLRSTFVVEALESGHESAALSAMTLLRLDSSHHPRRILCRSGRVWVTLEGSPADLILRSGDSVDLPPQGLALVEALRDSAIEITR